MGAGESTLEKTNDEGVVDEMEIVSTPEKSDDEGVVDEMEMLRQENRKLKKEVEEVGGERDRLRRERNERAEKYSKLKHKM